MVDVEWPEWPGLRRTCGEGYQWVFKASRGGYVSFVKRAPGGEQWQCEVPSVHQTFVRPTPQGAVDAAREWLAEHYGLTRAT